ncbi:MAG: chemotaxis signal relay system protein-glutamate methylesterase CheB [Roseibaca calidilacus]|uniref:Protein-glutamate methylesterase/protein-glutamine glutaminase n=1 Tax=Roseibaca calidilacus TaxID=1666912 RepID=A0A0P7YX75_9RHOB|nr:chemotaxis response regulator protein-glutamate methylesterase [Roseibaca calidilacus]KPP95532.1 MAG: chemotaxis signal relay system protein-glutamate methylesterase CheB [Roseibaca calidilacus]CUX82135.1 two-component system, chemotaxis family, response regulator CheB [Roseibaca calidilacus]
MAQSHDPGRPVRVLIVDDSAMIRKALEIGMSSDPGIVVIGAAHDGERGLEMARALAPDVITLDIEMPRLDGVSFMRRLMPERAIPTVVISAVTSEGAEVTLRALEAGAVDIIAKPSLGTGTALPRIMADICRRVRNAANARPFLSRPLVQTRLTARRSSHARDHVIVIGASTGGVQALAQLLPLMPSDAPGIAIVQHMPEGFTHSFAKRLNTTCAIEVREAKDGDEMRPGLALIAPGGSRHMVLIGHKPKLRVSLQEGPPVSFSTPSVDMLFDSAASCLGPSCSAALLTGMGKDGANGLLNIRNAGGRTIAQDEISSVVWGMPRQAVMIGAAQFILPLNSIAAALLEPPATALAQTAHKEGQSI